MLAISQENRLARRPNLRSLILLLSISLWPLSGLSQEFRWENPLMGWTSTGNPYANVGDAGLSFESENAAKTFAEKHGWEYSLWSSVKQLVDPIRGVLRRRMKGKRTPLQQMAIGDIRGITKAVAAAIIKEAIEEDLAEGYREMNSRDLHRLNKAYIVKISTIVEQKKLPSSLTPSNNRTVCGQMIIQDQLEIYAIEGRRIHEIQCKPAMERKKQVLLFAASNDSSKVAQTFVDVATLFKGKLIFVYVEMYNEDVGKPVGDYFGITGDAQQVYSGYLRILERASWRKKLKAFYKSDSIPENNDDDVKIVVGNNFEDIVLDESKDVLLEIYAPWCGHCQALEPTYNKLAKHLRYINSLVIAKTDGTTNEHPRSKVMNFFAGLLLLLMPEENTFWLICKEAVEEKILHRVSQKSTVQQLVMTGGHIQSDILAHVDVISLLIDDAHTFYPRWSPKFGPKYEGITLF
ncbi:hypothetical protein L2E82_16892 [Cichorium intybus]|uniref:Uncharacterized protein n=1 Tax=Cichorium intybus TaxID=13427 RepID=A0ACB9F7S1_CICIN|nr:hypothetical protein L2E82_16892 [Cichorium intybus]